MKVIQTNISKDRLFLMQDFQSCSYNIDMTWDEFREYTKTPDKDISNKISKSTITMSRLIPASFKYVHRYNIARIDDDIHFQRVYVTQEGKIIESWFYKCK